MIAEEPDHNRILQPSDDARDTSATIEGNHPGSAAKQRSRSPSFAVWTERGTVTQLPRTTLNIRKDYTSTVAKQRRGLSVCASVNSAEVVEDTVADSPPTKPLILCKKTC